MPDTSASSPSPSHAASPVAIVKAGQRFTFNGAHGSSDALLIARYRQALGRAAAQAAGRTANRAAHTAASARHAPDATHPPAPHVTPDAASQSASQPTPQAAPHAPLSPAPRTTHTPLVAVICASATDAQRLAQEIPYFAPDARVRLLPDWETLPYDTFSPHQDLVSGRLATLYDLGQQRCDILLAPATTALYRMPPASFLAAYTFSFAQSARLDEARLKAQLTLAGYEHVSQVVRPGEYCVRGSLIDLFPMGSPLPYRLDLFDDQVDSIRAFDPDTQRSLYPVKDVRLLPGREFPFDEAARAAFRSRWRELFEGDPSRAAIYRDIGNGVPSAGIEYYLPLFFDDTATLFHYLPRDAQLVFRGDLQDAIQRFTADTQQRHHFLSRDPERPILDPRRLFLNGDEFFALAKPFARLVLTAQDDMANGTGAAGTAANGADAGNTDNGAKAAGAGGAAHALIAADTVNTVDATNTAHASGITHAPGAPGAADATNTTGIVTSGATGAAGSASTTGTVTSGATGTSNPADTASTSGTADTPGAAGTTDAADATDTANPSGATRAPGAANAANTVDTTGTAHITDAVGARSAVDTPRAPAPAVAPGATGTTSRAASATTTTAVATANTTHPSAHAWSTPLPPLALDRHANDPLAALRAYLHASPARVLFTVESAGRRETLAQLFAEHHLRCAVTDGYDDWLASDTNDANDAGNANDARFALGVAPLARGFALPGENLAIVTETELYGPLARRAQRRRQEQASDVDSMVRDLAELKAGEAIVHAQHGIGRYRGLVTMDLGEGETEFLHLEYANHSKLYVPVAQLHVIARYSGADPDSAPLHALGSGQWERARGKAAQQIRDTAAELLNLYARRALRVGHAFALDARDYANFVERFGFEETPDQASAIDAVIGDMTRGQPMDRLVCGDVGFGKTEVALRAAFVAVMGGQQVAILSPTTLLAEQHTQTFTDRFADWPVRIAELSRFKSAKEVSEAIRQINDGSIDIVIGTHKLLSADVQFRRLGLVIIDEEHRFGVRQKEKLKALRAEVDVLTLTATPIPRTLGMALEGLRDFSVIATAPQKRLAIKTFVRREEDAVIREAMLRELKRGGQVYFLHNEVQTIKERHATLAALVPEARIAIAHGQMHERELESVMRDFVAQRTNVLLCTTIIETGIDVPSANTILIHRADKFGLAQLHQLRGRVGRSHHQAYAYLLVHDWQALTQQAQRRLEAIQQMEELGSGFYLAMHDLEIRGTGEVLGDKQSGGIQEIGFQLYTDMLADAVKALREGREPDLDAPLAATTEITLHTPAILPADFCSDVQERLSLYKRLANCAHDEAIDRIQEELIDRFGKLPPPARALVETHRLRLAAKPLGIVKIDAGEALVSLQFMPDPPIDALRIIELVQKHRHIKLAGQDRLRIETRTPDLAARVALVKGTLRALGAPTGRPLDAASGAASDASSKAQKRAAAQLAPQLAKQPTTHPAKPAR